VLRQRHELLQFIHRPKPRSQPIHSCRRGSQPGHHTGVGWIADRRLTMSVCEQGPALRQRVDIWGLDLWMTIQTAYPVIQIVDGEEQHIRLGTTTRAKSRKQDGQCKRKAYYFHDSKLLRFRVVIRYSRRRVVPEPEFIVCDGVCSAPSTQHLPRL